MFLIISLSAVLCECIITHDHFEKSWENAELVVLARTETIVDSSYYDITQSMYYVSTGEVNYDFGYHPKLKVLKTYKGNPKSDYLELNSPSSLCSYWFQTGEDYLIFVNIQDSVYSVSSCSPTFKIDKKQDIRKFERRIKKL